MKKLVPLLKSFDMARSLVFYQEILAAKVNWQWQHNQESINPSYASISLFDQEIHISSFAGDGTFGSAIYFYMDDIDVLYKRLVTSASSCIEMKPTLQPWKMYELYIRDPDNNNLRFGVDKTSQ